MIRRRPTVPGCERQPALARALKFFFFFFLVVFAAASATLAVKQTNLEAVFKTHLAAEILQEDSN